MVEESQRAEHIRGKVGQARSPLGLHHLDEKELHKILTYLEPMIAFWNAEVFKPTESDVFTVRFLLQEAYVIRDLVNPDAYPNFFTLLSQYEQKKEAEAVENKKEK